VERHVGGFAGHADAEPFAIRHEWSIRALTLLLRDDPSPLGLQVLIVLLCLNAIVQVTVHARSCRTAKVCVLVLSVLYGLFFLAHNIFHMVGGEPLGLQSVLDFTHHALAGFAIWGAWRWQKAA